jgi:sulfur-oxidizing protein SoxB
MFPNLSFGVREERIARWSTRCATRAPRWSSASATTASTSTARWPAVVDGIDVILTGHTHDALPEPVMVNDTR